MTATPSTAGKAGDVESLKGLLERVRAATGPDNRLDQMLFARFRGWSFPLHGAAWDEFRRMRHAVFYTESLDAAISLVREELPGTMWAVGNMEAGPFCRLVIPGTAGWGLSESEQDGGPGTEPLTVLSALLQALIARTETEGVWNAE